MSASPVLSRWTRRARRRGAVDAALVGAPAVWLAAAAGWRWGAAVPALTLAAAALALLALVATLRSRRFDAAWVTRRLDTSRPELEDSAGLLAADLTGLGPLQRLQRDRLDRRLSGEAGAGPLPAWSLRPMVVAGVLGLAAAAALAWPRAGDLAEVSDGPATPPGVPRLTGARLHVTPPAYTGLPARDLPGLDARVPQGSRMEWTLRFAPQPAGGGLAIIGGDDLPLRRAGGDWSAALILDRSRLYRVVAQGGPAAVTPPLHRLEAVPDAPPQVRVVRPVQTLTVVAAGRTGWSLQFEAADDYGVAADARLKLTSTEGSGEQVSFHDRELVLHGLGPPRLRRFSASLDAVSLGLKPGGDLVAQLMVSDTRTPAPQTTASPSLILRWPAPPETAAEGLDGAVKKVLPAYLRSERQIIIDAQQLLRERPGLASARFLARSDGIGADQQGLRLRYGQFLGGENERAENALPTSDADEAPARPAAADAPPPPPPAFGVEGDVVRTYGHAHDETESSAVEPSTRDKLKLSVDQMFQAETHLRQGDPAGAIPFAEKALAFLKEAQRAERVFVEHTGLQPPPIDESRRLTGKRDGLARDGLELSAAVGGDPALIAAWRALADTSGPDEVAAAAAALERWSRSEGARGVDPLALAAALDAVRRDAVCASCRRTLRALVWSALPRPPPHPARRAAPDGAGGRYLRMLGAGSPP